MLKLVRAWCLRAIGVFASNRSEREISAELEAHLQLHIDDNIRAGMPRDEARRRALVALGGIERTKEEYRDRRGLPIVESWLRDLRFGVRTLLKTPGFALAGVVILGLGIGANAAIFTVVNAVVLRPLPFADANRIMRLWHTPPPSLFSDPAFALSPANFIDWEAQSHSFEQMAIYQGGRRTVTGQGEPDGVATIRASASLLPIFGLSPTIGRHFTREEDSDGGPQTVILSEAFWRTRFGGEPSALGRTIVINGVPHTIVGVTPAPSFLSQMQLLVPLHWSATDRAVRNNHNYRGVAKLKPGVTVATAQADLTAISERLAQQYPADNKDWGALVVPLQDDLVSDARTALLVLLGAVALVLLIACANLANLMLVRTHARAKEIAVRTALGASRRRVVQQLLAEGLLLGIGGGVAGFAAVYFGVDALVTVFGAALPRANEVKVDSQALAFTAAIAMATGALAAFAPAWQLTGRDANEVLKLGASRGNSSGGDGRVRHLLVVSEVALALMLLIGAGLLVRSLMGLRAVDAGFDPRNVLTATIDIPMARYATPEQRNQFFDRVVQSVRTLPGVQSAAWIDTVPLQGGSTQYVAVEGHAGGPGVRAAGRRGSPAVARLLQDRPNSDPRRPRFHGSGWLRPSGRGDRQRAYRAALLAEPGPARQAHHAHDDVEGARRSRRRRARGEDRSAGCERGEVRDRRLRTGRAIRLQRIGAGRQDRRRARLSRATDRRRGPRHRSGTARARHPDDGERRR